MSQTENSSSESNVDSTNMMLSEYEENNGNFNVFEPYQGEPLASSDSETSEDDEQDLDGLSPSVLEQRMERTIPISSW